MSPFEGGSPPSPNLTLRLPSLSPLILSTSHTALLPHPQTSLPASHSEPFTQRTPAWNLSLPMLPRPPEAFLSPVPRGWGFLLASIITQHT